MLSNTYDDYGNLTTKTSNTSAYGSVQSYGYSNSGSGQVGPNSLTSFKVDHRNYTIVRDANGAITKYDYTSGGSGGVDKHIAYNAINQPLNITVGSSLTTSTPTARDEFKYGPEGNRYYKKSTHKVGSSYRTEHTFYVGNFEYTRYDSSHTLQWTKKTTVGNVLHTLTQPDSGGTYDELRALMTDHLGSVIAVADETPDYSNQVEQQHLAYEAFGQRRKASWTGKLNSTEFSNLLTEFPESTTRGFTGHEMLDRTGFIHMNGRLYDAEIGRFLSPDPIVKDPNNSQHWNRFAYVENNPLSLVDPTGYRSRVNGGSYDTTEEVIVTGVRQDSGCSSTGCAVNQQQFMENLSAAMSGSLDRSFDSVRFDAGLLNKMEQGMSFKEAYFSTFSEVMREAKEKGSKQKDAQKAKNPAQKIADAALKDGHLTLKEANAIYNANTDQGLEVTVDASKLTVDPKGKVPENGSVNAKVVGLGDWLVHGNVRVTSVDGVVTINSEMYDFDYKSGLSKIPRNIETYIGEIYAGDGTPFRINFDGSPSF